MGIKRGRAFQRKEMNAETRAKRLREKKITRLKEIYVKTKKAVKTGKFIHLDYQKRLLDIFENYDFTRMTAKTKESLERTRDFFVEQGGEINENIAKRISRLEKITVKDMADSQIEELIEVIEHIYSIGRLKLKLTKISNERETNKLIDKVVSSSVNLDDAQTIISNGAKKIGFSDKTIKNVADLNLKTLEAFRVADLIDGYQNYYGANHEMQTDVSEGCFKIIANCRRNNRRINRIYKTYS